MLRAGRVGGVGRLINVPLSVSLGVEGGAGGGRVGLWSSALYDAYGSDGGGGVGIAIEGLAGSTINIKDTFVKVVQKKQ